MLAANRVTPRATQALLRHTDPRLTAGVYTDEKLLPLAAELVNVPAVPAGQSAMVATAANAIDVQALVTILTPA